MQDLLNAIKDYYSKDNNGVDNRERITLRSQVKQLADRYFAQNPEAQSLTIEIEPRFLDYIDALFEDGLLNDNYLLYQNPGYPDQVVIEVRELDL